MRQPHSVCSIAAILWTLGLMICSAPAIVNPLLTTLENREYDQSVCVSGAPVVVLGGGVDSRIQASTEFERMHHATLARTAAAFRLAVSEPEVSLILSGGVVPHRTAVSQTGSGREADAGIPEAAVMAELLVSLGISRDRLVVDQRSVDTASNADRVLELLGSDRSMVPRLVTSAVHMPRAVAVFSHRGQVVCPVSADRMAISDVPWYTLLPQTTALVKFDRWLHEIIALLVYRLRGDL